MLNALGLAEDLLKIASSAGPANEPSKLLNSEAIVQNHIKLQALAFRMRKSDQPIGVHYYDMVIPSKHQCRTPVYKLTRTSRIAGGLSFHRADFLNCLASHLDRNCITTHFSKRLVGYTGSTNDPGAITVMFTDGFTANCDILIGSDGIHSTTRHIMLERAAEECERKFVDVEFAKSLREKKDPIWSGIVSYRALIPSEKLREINPTHRAFLSINAVSAITESYWVQ